MDRRLLLAALAFVCLTTGCAMSKRENDAVQSTSKQQIHTLNFLDKARLDMQRQAIEKYLGDENSKLNYRTAAGKLGTIRAILQAGIFKQQQTYELQCLGVVLGDAFVEDLGMEWIVVEDRYGRDLAMRRPGTSIILYPVTAISKRVEAGQAVNVFALYNALSAQVERTTIAQNQLRDSSSSSAH